MKKLHASATTLRRAELAKATGCNLETIRYYEKIGLMPEPPRSASNHRLYDATHLARLRFVMRARELGFSLEEVRELLRLVDGGAATCEEVKRVALAHLDMVRARIDDLRRIEAVLAETVARCAGGDAPECPMIEALQDAA